MKRLVIFLFVMILITPFSSAITTTELVPLLKEVLVLYFQNPSDSRLNVNELKDLLIVFFQTPAGKETDLSKNGKFSGKLLQDIYDKAKLEEWTIMIFMNADNNLEGFAVGNINELEQVGSSENVNVIVQLDRSPDYDASNGDWSTTKRFYVNKDNNTEAINSRELSDLGEVDMSNPKVLEDFILFSLENYPAKHYSLILWNHGSGWEGQSNDETDNFDGMGIQELQETLKEVKDIKKMKLDIIGFDECSMGMIEVYSLLADVADIAIGSEELEPGSGWDYASMLEFITENPNSDPKTFASEIVSGYSKFYEDSTITLSAVDLNKIGNVVEVVSEMSSLLNSNIFSFRSSIARSNIKVDRYNSPIGFSYIDLLDFLDWLWIHSPISGEIDFSKEDFLSVKEIISEAVIIKTSGVGHYFSSGISIYFPESLTDYDPRYKSSNKDFLEKTGWDKLLENYYESRKSDTEPPVVKIDSFEINPESADFKINLSGDDISSLTFNVELFYDNSLQLLLAQPLDIDFSFFEYGQVEYPWDFTIPFLYNGKDFSLAQLKTTDRQGRKFYVEGQYKIASTEETFDTTLYFDDGLLTNAYISIPTEEGFVNSPIEIHPGDIFIPYMENFDFDADGYFYFDGTPINIGDGLQIENAILGDSGVEYFVGFTAEDLSENFGSDGVIITK